MTKINYDVILMEAHKAAAEAVATVSIYMDEQKGACGFAWVVIPGNDPLARHCRKELKLNAKEPQELQRELNAPYGSKGYPTGWQFWNPGNHNGQRVDIKEAGAKAFAFTLAKYGIRADWSSRLD
jgi:hypothetical protein